MHQQVRMRAERRPRPMKRRSHDGIAKSVTKILADNIPAIVMGFVGCSCVFMPTALGIAGHGFWPFVIAYGGCLIGLALSEVG